MMTARMRMKYALMDSCGENDGWSHGKRRRVFDDAA